METLPSKQDRPVFLTILCIISFVVLGFTIFKNIISFIFGKFGSSFYNLIQNNLENSLNQINATNPAAASFVEKIFESILKLIDALPLLATMTIVLSVVALAGVIMMWSLIKNGFYVYAGAKIVLIFVPMMLIGINFLSMLMAMTSLFVAAIFITLYALNLKAMK
jgi:hypothetical protein